jgi:hypothetical protein
MSSRPCALGSGSALYDLVLLDDIWEASLAVS